MHPFAIDADGLMYVGRRVGDELLPAEESNARVPGQQALHRASDAGRYLAL